jgi:hypothetical protein
MANLERTFVRAGETVTIELRHEIASAEFHVISHLPGQADTTQRFTDQAEALAYFDFLEERLKGQKWNSEDGPGEQDPELSALYGLATPLVCPHCREWIRSVRVVRLSRQKVQFTSTLPRGGRALACANCDGILSLELTGLL